MGFWDILEKVVDKSCDVAAGVVKNYAKKGEK